MLLNNKHTLVLRGKLHLNSGKGFILYIIQSHNFSKLRTVSNSTLNWSFLTSNSPNFGKGFDLYIIFRRNCVRLYSELNAVNAI